MARLKAVSRGRARTLGALGAAVALAGTTFVVQPTVQVGAATVSLEVDCTMPAASAVEYGEGLVSSQVKQQLTASVLPLSIPGTIDANATVGLGGVIHTTGSLTVDIQPYAQNILETQVKPAVEAAQGKPLADTAFLNLTITNLKSTFPIPPQIASTSNLVVGTNSSIGATGNLTAEAIEVTLGEIKAGAYSLNPATVQNSTTSTSSPVLAPFTVNLAVDATVDPSTPVGTVIQLHPGPITFDLEFEVGVYLYGTLIVGGVTGPESCAPVNPLEVLATTTVTTRFNDVPLSHDFYDEIEWLASNGYANGYPDGGFHPTSNIARQAMAAFLYRYDGKPNGETPICTAAPYPDVPIGAPFCGEITWMEAQNITQGYPDGGFHPADPVARQAMAAFIYRFAGTPNGPNPTCSVAPYPDVAVGAPFCGEISWMQAEKLTQGYPDGGFHPTASVSRQAFAAFLQRYDASLP